MPDPSPSPLSRLFAGPFPALEERLEAASTRRPDGAADVRALAAEAPDSDPHRTLPYTPSPSTDKAEYADPDAAAHRAGLFGVAGRSWGCLADVGLLQSRRAEGGIPLR